jgi:exosortase
VQSVVIENPQSIDGHPPGVRRHILFLCVVIGVGLASWNSIKQLVGFSLTHDYGSHILLALPVCIYLVVRNRSEIFANAKGSAATGLSLAVLGGSLVLAAHFWSVIRAESLSVEIVALVVLWIAAFLLCYGVRPFREAQFPLLFLLLLVPIPKIVVDECIFALQAGSADVAYGLLRALSIPIFKDGFVLRLPQVNLEVARECSGIRSSLALLITLLVADHFFLRSPWRKVVLLLASLPILVIKNGIRIATLYLLTTYVDPGFLHGTLHTSGGVLFYLLGLIAMMPIAIWLRRGELAEVPNMGTEGVAQALAR